MYNICGVMDSQPTRPAYEIERNFLGMMSHELRTPLQSVLGYTALLLGGHRGPLTEEQCQDLSDIQIGAERLMHLFEQMLDLSHIHAGELSLNVERVELGEHLVLVHEVFGPVAASKGLALKLNVAGELPSVRCDPARLRQVLQILIDNAIKFTERGEVRLQAESRGNQVNLAVQDTGIGIAPDMLSRIFVPFRQADNSTTRSFGGAGLGLALAAELVRMMEGRLDVESKLGDGATFTLQLPTCERSSPLAAQRWGLHCP